MLQLSRRAVRPREAPSPTADEVFLERYQDLLARALHLTRGEREDARDLVQDAYVHFVLGRTPIEEIRDFDAYLHTMLRHLHVSQIRRRVRHPQAELDPLDFDVADFALRGAEAGRRQQVVQELRLVLEYACGRRRASKAASVLLLRYFHGYYVREIAQVLKAPARVVDNLLHVGRREARAFSDQLHGAFPKPRLAASYRCLSRAEGLDDLRAAIFALAHDSCYQPAWFDACYGREAAVPLDGETLAALVTCARCLDQANAALGLSLLAERYPTDMLGPDRRTPPGSGSARGGTDSTIVARLRRKVTDVTEHKPRELFVSVNGFIVGSQPVHGKCTEQTVSLTLPETPGFVEVFSEQQVQLLFMMVEPPPSGGVEQGLRVVLGEGRSLAVDLSFSDAWPTLRVAYDDPQWMGAALDVETAVAADEPRETPRMEPRQLKPRWWQRVRQPRWPPPWGALLRPGGLPATAFVLLLAWVAIHHLWGTSNVSARELLRRAATAEDVKLLPQEVVRHRVFDLEELRGDDGVLLSRTKVESWEGRGGQYAVRRYDAAGALLSLNLTTAGHGTVLYRRGLPPTVAPGTGSDEARRAIESGDAAHLAPSARTFEAIVAGLPEGRVKRTTSACTIEYRAERAPADHGLVRASLQLTPDGLRTVGQALVIAMPSGLREFRFTERTTEAVPERDVDTLAAFRPDLSFEMAPAAPPSRSDVPHANVLSSDEQAALSVEALFLLDQAGATLGDEIQLRADATGMSVDVLVGDAGRKRRVLEALAPISLHPGVQLNVRTVAEASREHAKEPTKVTAREVGPEQPTIPAATDLQRYLSSRVAAGADEASRDRALQRQVTEFAARALGGARQALMHAWALQHLLERVPLDRIERLDPPVRAKWRSMVREHSLAFLRATELLRLEVEPVFVDPGASPLAQPTVSGSPAANQRDTDIESSIRRVLALAREQDEAIRSAFALPTSAAESTMVVRDWSFWDRVRQAESLAKRLAEIES